MEGGPALQKEFQMSFHCVDKLAGVTAKLSGGDQAFAKDLVYSIRKYKKMSPKQEFWVNELVKRAENPAPAKPMASEKVGDFAGVMALFAAAKQHLKYPKIKLLAFEQEVELSLAGPKAKCPGTVNVTDGRPFGQNVWFGRVDAEGNYSPNPRVEPEAAALIKDLLTGLANDPVGVAKSYGALTGKCCFCNLKLTDEKSTAAGFGPVCAKNYGLSDSWKAGKGLFSELAKEPA